MNKFREIEVFIKEYESEGKLERVADIQATLKYAEKLLNSMEEEEIETSEGYAIFSHLIAACEEMERYLKNPLGHQIDCWYHTPLVELIPEEPKIREALDKLVKDLGLDPYALQFCGDEYVLALVDLIQEIGLAKAEREAELKGCECPEWLYEDDTDERTEEDARTEIGLDKEQLRIDSEELYNF